MSGSQNPNAKDSSSGGDKLPAGDAGSADSPLEDDACPEGRRSFLTSAATVTTLAASYGTLGYMAGQYLYAQSGSLEWQFVCTVDGLPVGGALSYTSPSGGKVTIVHHGDGGDEDDFLALSSVCPHLGCIVHWEGQNNRFFCPCHNGAFDKQGNPIAGPPAQANQPLTRYPLKVENLLVYVKVPLKSLRDKDHV